MKTSKMEILEGGVVQVRQLKEDGSYHRIVKYPGDDISDIDDYGQSIIQAVHTPELIAARQAELAEKAIEEEALTRSANEAREAREKAFSDAVAAAVAAELAKG